MAALKAHGQEIARLTSTERLSDDRTYRSQVTLAIFTDRVVLEKLTTRAEETGARHDYGWKRKGIFSSKIFTRDGISDYIEKLKRAGYAVDSMNLSIVL